jgi:DNA-directed RNA polymerase specialized sigma24 family protein
VNVCSSRASVDFSAVEFKHEKIDARLRNWARWCMPKGEGYPGTAAGFSLYRSSDARRSDADAPIPINTLDATAIQKAVNSLPQPHMHAVNWHYVKQGSARVQAQRLGVSLGGLAMLVRDARQMLINKNT